MTRIETGIVIATGLALLFLFITIKHWCYYQKVLEAKNQLRNGKVKFSLTITESVGLTQETLIIFDSFGLVINRIENGSPNLVSRTVHSCPGTKYQDHFKADWLYTHIDEIFALARAQETVESAAVLS